MGFISNSSSASFVIDMKMLTPGQINKIYNHLLWGIRLGIDKHHKYKVTMSDQWSLLIDNDKIVGTTSMTNFDIRWFLKKIKVPEKAIKYEDDQDGNYDLL